MLCPYCGSVVADSAQKCSSCLEWINLDQKPPWAAEVQALWQVVFDYARSQKAGGRGTAEADMAGLGRAVYEHMTRLMAEGKGPPWLARIPPH